MVFLISILWCGQSDNSLQEERAKFGYKWVRENSRMFLEWRTYCLNMATSTKFFFLKLWRDFGASFFTKNITYTLSITLGLCFL
jgi:hypothetical protein